MDRHFLTGEITVTDTDGLHQIDNMTHGAVNNELRNLMRWNYCGISRCNFILESKENEINFASKATVLAEAKFLRAFYYFELVKVFGDMPLIINKRIGNDEVLSSIRNPASVIHTYLNKIGGILKLKISSCPLVPFLEEVKTPLLSVFLSKIIPKSCSGEFRGYLKFSTFPHFLSPVL